jgi:hypothetical protein
MPWLETFVQDLQPEPETTSHIPKAPPYSFNFPQTKPKPSWYKDPRYKIVLRWVWLTIAGGVLGCVISFVLAPLAVFVFFGTMVPSQVSNSRAATLIFWLVLGASLGAGLGLMQKIALAKFLAGANLSLWGRLSIVGAGLGLVASVAVLYGLRDSGLASLMYEEYYSLPESVTSAIPVDGGISLLSGLSALFFVLSLCIAGFVLGCAQWIILSRYVVNAWLWVAVNVAGWSGGGVTVLALTQIWPVHSGSGWDAFLHAVVMVFVYLFVLGTLNGYVLAFFLRVRPGEPTPG